MDECLGNQQAEVFIAFPILAQQHQMIRVIIHTMDTVSYGAARKIYLTADDWFDTCSLRCFIKVNTAIHHTVICDGYCCLS